jgi:hypothetical protein
MPRPSHSSPFCPPNNIGWTVQMGLEHKLNSEELDRQDMKCSDLD